VSSKVHVSKHLSHVFSIHKTQKQCSFIHVLNVVLNKLSGKEEDTARMERRRKQRKEKEGKEGR
jgi:hypothetical protein